MSLGILTRKKDIGTPLAFGIITLLHCETNVLKFTECFFRFCKHSTHCVLQTLRLLHSTGCKIIATVATVGLHKHMGFLQQWRN